MYRIVIYFLILSFFSTICYAIKPRFKVIEHKDGLSQSEVYSFLKDSRNFMWIGTVDGLNKYDGYKIEKFYTDRNDSQTISNNTVRSLAEDQYGRIWIGTDNGISLYDPIDEQISQLVIPNIDNDIAILDILMEDQVAWITTSGGLFLCEVTGLKLDLVSSSFQQIIFPVQIIADSRFRVNSVIKANDGTLWAQIKNFLVNFIRNENGQLVFLRYKHLPTSDEITNLVEDEEANLWGTYRTGGLFRYNPFTDQLAEFYAHKVPTSISSDAISDLAFDRDGNLWVATIDKGLNFLPKLELQKTNPVFQHFGAQNGKINGLNSDLIYELYVSSDNILWVGTIGNGVALYDPKQKDFEAFRIPSDKASKANSNFIRALFLDQQNHTWIGTHNNGLFIYDTHTKDYKKVGFETQSVFYLADAGKGKVWVCNNSGLSLVKYDGNQLIELFRLEDEASFFITKSKNNVFWLASLSGLTRIDVANMRDIIVEPLDEISSILLSQKNTRVVYYDSVSNSLLAGTEGGGLNQINLNQNHMPVETRVFRKNATETGLSSNYIRAIYNDDNGRLWLGTYEGLNLLLSSLEDKELNFKTFSTKQGLPNNMIQSILGDQENNLWLGTNNGLSKFDPGTGEIHTFTPSDGLTNWEFSEHTAIKTPKGRFLFGGTNGIDAFYPQEIIIKDCQSTVTITDFYLFNERASVSSENAGVLSRSILMTDSIVLDHNENDLGFEFSAMIFTNPDKITYAHKLEGYDKQWIIADANHRKANYTNLSYGEYRFLVKATNSDGIWSEEVTSVYIKIRKPFVLTPWAFFLYFLLVVLIFFYLTTYSVMKITTKKKLILENDHSQKIHELDEIRTRFFINISHDLRTPLSLILSPLKRLKAGIDESSELSPYLNLITKNVYKLNYLIEQILDIRKAETGFLIAHPNREVMNSFIKEEVNHFSHALAEKNIKLSLKFNEEIQLAFDRDIIGKVLFNLLSNAIKHSEEGVISIGLKRISFEELKTLGYNPEQTEYVEVAISDSGSGMSGETVDRVFDRFYQNEESAHKGFGIGLSHCKDLIDAHRGFISLDSIKGRGTTVRFYVPSNLDEQEFRKDAITPAEDMLEQPAVVATEDELSVDSSKPTILLVEDNADMREYLKLELQQEYNIKEAEDGEIGERIATEQVPDLIISDIMMPNTNGVEMCMRLKANVNTSHIPIILLTAKTDKQTKYDSYGMGADDYVSKPFDIDLLQVRIENLLEQRSKLRKLFEQNITLSPSSITVTPTDEKFITQLMEELEKGIPDSNFSVNTLESAMGMSHANFYRKVKSLTGKSGKELLQSMRMQRAHQILSDQDMRVSEVAYMVGFNNPKYFTKCFKEEYGILPSAVCAD